MICFLVACRQPYKPLSVGPSVGQSIGWSICWLVGPSVGRSVSLSVAEGSEHATYGNRPCFITITLLLGELIMARINFDMTKILLKNIFLMSTRKMS